MFLLFFFFTFGLSFLERQWPYLLWWLVIILSFFGIWDVEFRWFDDIFVCLIVEILWLNRLFLDFTLSIGSAASRTLAFKNAYVHHIGLPTGNVSTIFFIALFLYSLLKLFFKHQIHLILWWKLWINNDTFKSVVHIHSLSTVLHPKIFTPSLIHLQGFECNDLVFDTNHHNESLDWHWKFLGFCYCHVAKLEEIKIKGFDIISVLFIHFVHKIFYNIRSTLWMKVSEDHVDVEKWRFKQV